MSGPDTPHFRSVLKLGGSLLTRAGLRQLLPALAELAEFPLWIVGGGVAADVVRDWDEVHNLRNQESHRLALAAMDFNARLLEALLPPFRRARDPVEAAQIVADRHWPVVEALAWTESREAAGVTPLPRSWDITSDSIAAWIARDVGAQALWLAKSVDAPGPQDDPHDPKVDPCFAEQARGIPVLKWVNAAHTPFRPEGFFRA